MKIDESFFDNLDSDLAISKTELDEEWVRQPQLFMKYATASAELKRKAQEAQERSKLIKAELKANAAENPDRCLGRGVKASNEKIEAYASAHEDYQTAVASYIKAQYRADMAENAVFAMHQKKSALENLVRLSSMEWYSTPTVTSENRGFDGDAVRKAAYRKASETKAKRRS